MKRIISMLLLICMLFQIMPATAFAFENEMNSTEINQGAICNPDIVVDDEGFSFSIKNNTNPSMLNSGVSIQLSENQVSTFGLRSEQTETVRYSILVLDTSASSDFVDSSGDVFYTANTAINYVKTASKKFISDIQKASGINYVAIVEYKGSGANIVSEFSTDYTALSSKIDSLYASENIRSVSSGLETAYSLLEKITDETAKKNVVLFTTGMTNEGDYTYDGKYNEDTVGSNWRRMDTQIRLYAYANAAINQSDRIKDTAMLYSVGLFQTMENMPDDGADIVEFFKLFASDIATSSDYFYDVNDPNNLEFVFGEIADDVTGVGNKFNFAGALEEDYDSSAEYYYTDEYFFKDPDIYNSSLATMSLCLELSTWSSYDYDDWYNPNLTTSDDAFWEDKLVNVKTLLLGSPDDDKIEDGYGGIGFDHFAANSFWEEAPQKDSIGVVAARKQITDKSTGEDYTLVAVVVRGGGYGNEWASNVTVGDSGDHQGFADSRDKVLNFLQDEYLPYLEEDESKNIKLWIVGYSRAGATANMVAGAINEGYSLPHNISDVYCYAFAAPMGALGSNISGTHNNIHNVINLNDVVPYVAPYRWGFERYNQDKDYTLPTAATTRDWDDAYEAMIDELEKLGYSEERLTELGYIDLEDEDETNDHIVPEVSIQQNLKIDKSKFLPGGEPLWKWEDSEVNTQYILTDGVDFLADDVLKSRGYYAENLQYVIRQVMGIITHYYGMGAGLEDYAGEVFDLEQFMQNMSELFTMDNIVYIISPIFNLNPFYSYDERVEDVELRLMEKMGSIFREYAEISGFIDALAEILVDVILQVAADAWDNNTDSVNLVIKFVDVMMNGVLRAHYPEVCLAWVRSQDPNYNKQFVDDGVNSSITRIIRINCPVNINVYDENGALVASIIDDVVVDNLGSIICLINSNGEKIVYLPGDGEYSIDIIATDDGYVSYAVDEFNYIYGTETRIENYYDISINTGDVLKALVPEIPSDELSNNSANGSDVTYVLEDSNSNSIPADSSYRGDQINDIYYTVALVKEGNSGYITGAGTFIEGRFAEVEAQILPSGEFLGWYENGVLVSSELTYRFAVRQDVTLTAKFTDIVFHELKMESTVGGTVSSIGGYYSEGIEVAVVAEANEGYVFDHWTTSNGGTFDDPYNPSTTFTVPNSDTILTAHFKESVPFTKYDVTVNGSYAATTGAGEYEAGATVTISAGTRSGYTFAGWTSSDVTITNKDSNTATFTMPAKAVTVTANWTMNVVIPTVFPVTVKDSDNGEVTASSHYAAPGTTVRLTVTPDEGYELDTMIVKYGSKEVETTLENGKYQFTMPFASVTVTATFKKIETPVVPNPVVLSFDDVAEGTYYFDAVEWAVENGITTGTSKTTFSPDMTCTRAQAVTFLWRAAGSPTPKSDAMPFNDVQVESYYYNAVLWAVESGITAGTSETTFSPNAECTRAQIVTFLWRSQKSPATIGMNPFIDVVADTYYTNAVLWAVAEKITAGTSETTFSPDADCTRAQIVTFLYRCLGDEQVTS